MSIWADPPRGGARDLLGSKFSLLSLYWTFYATSAVILPFFATILDVWSSDDSFYFVAGRRLNAGDFGLSTSDSYILEEIGLVFLLALINPFFEPILVNSSFEF